MDGKKDFLGERFWGGTMGGLAADVVVSVGFGRRSLQPCAMDG